MNDLKKIVIPIAGLGTRMLPATKAIPKEMLPIVNKPIIQYIVEEVLEAGFKEIIFVTHSSKSSVENHFDTSFELEAALEKRVKRALLKEIKSISKLNLVIHTIRQGEAKGLGHAILCAKSLVGKEPFGIALPDMVIKSSNKNNLTLMKTAFKKNGCSSILLGEAKKEQISKYGIVKLKKNNLVSKELKIESILEKPSLKKAPSNLFAVGRYIFRNEFMEYLSEIKPDKGDEIQLTEAIDMYLKNDNELLAFRLDGKFYDCGDKLGYLIANIEYAKEDPYLKKEILKYLKNKK
tara:strand:- start:644 stop:1522 length:879 start_codon:yes stop_codon:yes gene_type:complete